VLSIGAANTTIVNGSPATTTETVIATTSPVATPKDPVIVLLVFMAVVQAGTGSTGVTYRVRQGTTTAGTAIQQNVNTDAVAGAFRSYVVLATDFAIAQANAQWSLTYAGIGNTGNATVSQIVAAVIFLQ
jgi:hypothetical protein